MQQTQINCQYYTKLEMHLNNGSDIYNMKILSLFSKNCYEIIIETSMYMILM